MAQPPANRPPAVSLVSPIDGMSFFAPAVLALVASASDADGTVTGVEFYSGSTFLGRDASPPYSLVLMSVPTGRMTLTAVATDDKGATTTSARRDGHGGRAASTGGTGTGGTGTRHRPAPAPVRRRAPSRSPPRSITPRS